MKKFLMAILLVLLFAGHVSAEPIILKMAHIAPSKKLFSMTNIWLPWVVEMNKAGEGMFRIETYLGGTLNSAPSKQLQILREGVADIAVISPGATPDIFADDFVVGVPFVANKSIDASLAIHNMLQKNMLRNYDRIVPLMLACDQQSAIHSTFPIKTPADLKGKNLLSGGQLKPLIAKSLGAAPIAVPLPQMAASMNQGAIQATITTWLGMTRSRLDEVAKYHCMLPMGTASILLAMNKDSFNRLPKKAQDLFLAKQEYTARLWAEQLDMHYDEHYNKIKADPEHHVYTPTEAEMELWKEALQPAVEEWTNTDPRRKVLLDTYKAEVAKAMK